MGRLCLMMDGGREWNKGGVSTGAVMNKLI
jgi:hypothetical protein